MNIAEQIKQVENKIMALENERAKLDFTIAVEKGVYDRLKAIDEGNQSSLFGKTQSVPTPGSMPCHIEAVLIDVGKPMKISAIADAVKKRGAAGKTHAAILNNVRGTLKRRNDLFERSKRGVYKLKHKMEIPPET